MPYPVGAQHPVVCIDSLEPRQPPMGDDDMANVSIEQMTSALRAVVKEMTKDVKSSQVAMEQRLLSAIEEAKSKRPEWVSEGTGSRNSGRPRKTSKGNKGKFSSNHSNTSARDEMKAKALEHQITPQSFESDTHKVAQSTDKDASTDKLGMARQASPKLDTPETRNETWKTVVWKVLSQPESSKLAKAYDFFAPFFFLVTAGMSLSQTLAEPILPHNIALLLNFFVDVLFFAEMGLYWIVAPDRMAFLFSKTNMVDIAVCSIPLMIRVTALLSQQDEVLKDVVFLGVIGVVRLSKIARRLHKMLLVKEALSQIAESLPILLYILMVIVLGAAVAVYSVEDRETFPSLRGAIWFTAVTMSTVGYGDMYPVTAVGQSIVGSLAIMSLLYMAMPIGIIGHIFTDVWQRRDRILLCRKMQAILLVWGYKVQDIPTLFSIFDSKETGALDYQDFRRMMHQMQLGLTNERISALFQSIDISGNGGIEEAELVKALFPGSYHEIFGYDEEDDQFCPCGSLLVPYATSCRVCGADVATSPRSPSRMMGRSPSSMTNASSSSSTSGEIPNGASNGSA